jgi:hypothetical protein
VVYDSFLTTVLNAKDPDLADVDEINVDSLLDTISGRGQREYFFDIEDIDERGNPLPQPELDIEWLAHQERQQRQRARQRFGPKHRIPRQAETNEGAADEHPADEDGDEHVNNPSIVGPNDDDDDSDSDEDDVPSTTLDSDSPDNDNDKPPPMLRLSRRK